MGRPVRPRGQLDRGADGSRRRAYRRTAWEDATDATPTPFAPLAFGLDEQSLILSLHAGEEAAFLAVVEGLHPCLARVARALSPGDDEAGCSELLEATWMRLLQAAERLEVGSPLRVWVLRMLVACARERAGRPGHELDLAPAHLPPVIPPSRFRPRSDRHAGNWASPPRPWENAGGEERAAAALADVLPELGPAERTVFTLRDVEGWSAGETAAALGIDDRRQRALLNLARSRLRSALEERLAPGAVS